MLIKSIYKKSTPFFIYFKNYRYCGYTCNPGKFEIPALKFPCKVPVNPCKHLQCTTIPKAGYKKKEIFQPADFEDIEVGRKIWGQKKIGHTNPSFCLTSSVLRNKFKWFRLKFCIYSFHNHDN